MTPPLPPAGVKVPPAAAQYGPGMKSAHCGICQHFLKPNACEIVAGPIRPSMWCIYFSLKKAAAQR